MDSLIIADMIEVIGSEVGVLSNLPECTGAIFVLDPGWDLGAPQPVSSITAQMSLDGERPYGRRSSDRTLSVPVNILAPDRKTLVAARETLYRAIDQETWPMKWTRDDSPNLDGSMMSQSVVFDCFRGLASKPVYSITDEQQLLCHIDLTIPALPYGRSAIPKILAFKTNIVDASYLTDEPPDAILLDSYASIAGGNPGWSVATGAFGGSDAALFPAAPGTTPQYVKVFGTDQDLTNYTCITAHVGLAVPSNGIYVRSTGTNFSVSVTLVDSMGVRFALEPLEVGLSVPFRRGRTTPNTKRGEHGFPVYKKHPIIIGDNIPDGFDITEVHGYSLSFSDNPDGTVDFNDVYLGYLWVCPPTSAARSASVPVPKSSRGIVYDLNGVVGTAQAPITITGQQFSYSGMFEATSEFSSYDVWEAPPGTTEIQLEMLARGGVGAPTTAGGSVGGAGAGGAQYRQDPAMPTTPGSLYYIVVDVDGNVSFTGDSGRVCTAAAGSSASGGTGGEGGTGGTDYASQFHHDGGDGASTTVTVWDSGTSYVIGDNVTYGGVTYTAVSTNSATPPLGADTPVTVLESDSSVAYSGSDWVSGLTDVTDATATITFTGVQIALTMQVQSNMGEAHVTVDGGAPTTIDGYAASPGTAVLFTSALLADGGVHTVVITALGTHSGSSSDNYVGLISYDYAPGLLSADWTVDSATVLEGGGGGSAGGATGAGNYGIGMAGGTAVAPGAAGGNGGDFSASPGSEAGNNGSTPGAGGGGAAQDAALDMPGGTGGSVWVRMTYQQSIPSLFPNFIAHIPNYEASDIAPFYVPLGSSGPEGSGTDLASGSSVTVGSSITSPRNLFKLKVQADGNVVVYHPGLRGGIGDGPADWSTKTAGSGSANYLTMETDGNLELHHAGGALLWSSNTEGNSGAHLELMPDGMLVIFDTSGNPIWSNRRFPNTTMTVSPNDVADDGSVCFNARWNGTYSILLAPLLWAHPTVQRTMTATITQYGFQGGLPYVQTLSCFTKPSSWANGIVTIGEMTIPDRELPPENTGAYYTVSFDTGDPDDRLLDALFFDSMGQLVTINVSGAGYSQYYIDEPTPDVDVGYISGSMRDRKESVGVMSSTFVSGGPLTLQTGMTQIFLYSINGAPALIASYFPRWFVDLWDV